MESIVIAALAALATQQATANVDLDGDGVADAHDLRAVYADLNADGSLETMRWSGTELTVLDGASGESFALRAAAEITGVRAEDRDADGRLDLLVHSARGTASIGLNAPPGHSGSSGGEPGIEFTDIWDSGGDLNNLWDIAAGNLDGDAHADILGENWPTPTMRVYENNGDDMYAPVYSTPTADAPPGAYLTVTIGDSDQDGSFELVGGEASTLNQVFLYEAVGDNAFVKRDVGIDEPDFSGQKRMGDVVIADTDGDGKREIIFSSTSSTGAGAELFIYEHSGNPGDNTYTKVYTYSTVSYLFNFAVGDSDNDGQNEIVLAFGGFPNFPTFLRRLENTGDNTYEHKSTQPGTLGLALAPVVGDFDGDGLNELLFGAGTANGGAVFIYEATADDTYAVVHDEVALVGNGISATSTSVLCRADTVGVVGGFGGSVSMWGYDGANYAQVLAPQLNGAGPIRSVVAGALDGDSLPDLAYSAHVVDVIYVAEQSGPSGEVYCTAKSNSCGSLPAISASGVPSAAASDGFLVRASATKAERAGLLLYSDAGRAEPPLPFQGGFLCVEPSPLRRTIAVVDTVGTPTLCDGELEIDMNAFAAGALGGSPLPSLRVPGTVVACQFWARDTLQQGSLLSDGLEYTVCP